MPDHAPTPPAQERPIIPEHTVLQRIGVGAYGQVWLARNPPRTRIPTLS